MAASKLVPLSEAQREIMELLWKKREATVGEIVEAIAANRPVARNTVQTLMVRMEEKGWLRHRVVGRTFVYSPTRDKQQSRVHSVKSLLDRLFGGSAEQMVNALLEDHSLSADEADRIRHLIDQAEQHGEGTSKSRKK